jgi:lysophospholipase L1-like esterase
MAPSPLLSVGKPAMAGNGATNPGGAVDGRYHTNAPATFPAPNAQTPPFVAINVGAGASRLLLAWADTGFGNYTDVSGGAPVGYRIETSADTTNGSDGTWTTVADVTNNPVRNRAHTFPFAGKSWVRFSATAPAAGRTSVAIDEIAIHDVTAAGDARPADTWFFMGDSITAGAFKRNLNNPFDAVVHASRAAYTPMYISGGIGGELSGDGAGHIDQWLALNPDVKHFAILYGTNDSWDNSGAAAPGMQTNLTAIVDKIVAAGAVPILARIPYASMHHATLGPFNAAIDDISTLRNLTCGPDFYGYFLAHPTEIGGDGVHPNDVGSVSINRLWAEVALRLYAP